jgi:hypothetical protein
VTHVVCIDTEYDARYTDRGVARLACMTYSVRPGHAAIAGPDEAIKLWAEWVNDPEVTILGHSVYNDVAVLAQESFYRVTGRDCVPGFDWSWELAHRLYEHDRVIDTEIHQRLTQIRFGPHKASVRLGDLAKQLFGEDKSDAKDVPDEVHALLLDAVPYAEWPADLLERAPHRVKFGYYLERFGGDHLDRWPREAVDYALDDVRLPWRLHEWQQRRWNGRAIPDAKMQVKHSWMLHLVSIPGWVADRERAASIRERYREVIRHCDRTLVDCGILHVPGRKLTAKRGRLQGLIADAFGGNPPLTKSTTKDLTPEQLAALSPTERRDAAVTDAKTVKQAIERAGGPVLTLDTIAFDGIEAIVAACRATTAPELNAHALYTQARALAKKEAADTLPIGDNTHDQLAEALLPLLTEAGLIEVSHPRTVKKDRVADYVYAILGDETPLSKTAAETLYNPTPAERRKNASTAAKTVRQAIIHAEGSPLNVVDAVEKAEGSSEGFDAWLAASKQAQLNAFAVRSRADKVISAFLDRLDTPNLVRTTYQTLVDTGRTSARGGKGHGRINVQFLPRDYDKPAHLHTRGCILPPPGFAFIVADYSQLELCALAHVLTQLVRFYAADPKRKAYAERLLGFEISEHYESSLSRAINNDQDCHVLMASVLRGRGETYEECNALYQRADEKKAHKEKLDPDEKQVIEDRQLAKPCNFGYPGGLGEKKFIDYAAGYGVTITLPIAKRSKQAYMIAWPEMRLYFDHIGRLTADGNAVIIQFVSERERGDCWFTKVANGFFQALAADGAKYAGQLLVKHAYRIENSPLYGCRPSGFVHDEYLVNAPIDRAETARPEVERLMVEGMRRYIPDVKIKAPGKVLFDRWGK